jgi:PAS domain S-box-containing protein
VAIRGRGPPRAEALRENQQLLSSITDNIYEAVYHSSPEHGLLFVNRAYVRMFGYSSIEELHSVPREKLYANPADREWLLALVASEGGLVNQEVEYRRKDGSTFWALSSSTGIFDQKTGKLIYHVGTIIDITERKKAQDEIRQLNQSLESRILERTAELRASEAGCTPSWSMLRMQLSFSMWTPGCSSIATRTPSGSLD